MENIKNLFSDIQPADLEARFAEAFDKISVEIGQPIDGQTIEFKPFAALERLAAIVAQRFPGGSEGGSVGDDYARGVRDAIVGLLADHGLRVGLDKGAAILFVERIDGGPLPLSLLGEQSS